MTIESQHASNVARKTKPRLEIVTMLNSAECVASVRALVFRYVLASVRCPNVADDIVQETMMSAIMAVDSEVFDDEQSFHNWVVMIARRKIADHFRKKRSGISQNIVDDADGDILRNAVQPEQDNACWLTSSFLEMCRLNQQELTIINRLKCSDSDQLQVVAEELGLTRDAVYTAKRRAFEKIRERWNLVKDDSED